MLELMQLQALAELNEIDIRYYNVIYDAVKDQDALQGMLAQLRKR